MKSIINIAIFLLVILSIEQYSQEQTALIYDPYGVSDSFQYSFSILSVDSLFYADTIDNSIHNYDALFLFLGYPYVLNQEEGNQLINYLQNQNPIYLYTDLQTAQTDSVDFWNFIGLDWYAELALAVLVDSVIGVDSEFTNGVSIDTSFFSYGIPLAYGNLIAILIGQGYPIDLTYISGNDSVKIIVDQYYQIYHTQFLEKVLIHFGLEEPNNITDHNYNSANDYYLSQNYPNPFNPTTIINYQIPELSFVTIKVYDVLGSEIETLVNEEKSVGTYEITWHVENLPSGTYFYKLQVGNFVETKKMILMK